MNQNRIVLSAVVFVIVAIVGWAIWVRYWPDSTRDQLTAVDRPLANSNELSQHYSAQVDAASLSNGARLYTDQCASCHGSNLEGEPAWKQPNSDGSLRAPPHDDSGHTWHHDDKMLFRYTKKGGKALMDEVGINDFQSGMPGYGDVLSDEEIFDVLAYIKSHWSERSLQVQRQRTHAMRAADNE